LDLFQPRNLKKKVIPTLTCGFLSNCHGNLKRTPPKRHHPPRNKACLVKGLLTTIIAGRGGIWGYPYIFMKFGGKGENKTMNSMAGQCKK